MRVGGVGTGSVPYPCPGELAGEVTGGELSAGRGGELRRALGTDGAVRVGERSDRAPVRNRQPLGGSFGLGRSPPSTIRSRSGAPVAGTGDDDSSAAVYGCCGDR